MISEQTYQVKNQLKMEENISYRRLRNRRPKPVSGISPSLIQPHQRFKDLPTDLKDTDAPGKNVSTYEYMLCNHHIKEKYIKWATHLREYPKQQAIDKASQGSQKILSQPYKVYYKNTETRDLKKSSVQPSHSNVPINTGEYCQYFAKMWAEQTCLNSSISEITYMNNLRNYPESSSGSLHGRPRFIGIPIKDKHDYPKLLKKTALKKMRNICGQDKENGLDGSHRFPTYSYSILREKNVSLINPLIKRGQKVSLPSLSWAVGLRAYKNKSRKEDPSTSECNF